MTRIRMVVCGALATLLLAGCGAGGGGSVGASMAPARLEILTPALPDAARGSDYGPVSLEAVGAAGPVLWRHEGGLPAGVSLSESGTLRGTPDTVGTYPFQAEVADGVDVASRSFVLVVKPFGVRVDGLQSGDAWGGRPLALETTTPGPYTLAVVLNESGGTLESVDPERGTAMYTPGPIESRGAIDVIRVTDVASGIACDVVLPVTPDPLVEHDAEWGLSDVWYVDFEHKHGDHAYASDWHASLARLGLRAPESTDARGTECDRLADMACRVAVLRRLNAMFLRDPDGSRGLGLDISFPFEKPESLFVSPAPGERMAGAPNGYSIVSVVHAGGTGPLGMTLADLTNNGTHENATPTDGTALGVFVDRIVDEVAVAYDDFGDLLQQDPVGPGDAAALKALLYGESYGPSRFVMLRYVADGLARSVAARLAHEVGHGVGLDDATTPGTVMALVTAIHEDAQYRLAPDNVAALRVLVPGAGRSGAP